MIGNPTTIAGIPLPSDAPLFLAFIALHLAAGLTAVIAGGRAVIPKQGRSTTGLLRLFSSQCPPSRFLD